MGTPIPGSPEWFEQEYQRIADALNRLVGEASREPIVPTAEKLRKAISAVGVLAANPESKIDPGTMAVFQAKDLNLDPVVLLEYAEKYAAAAPAQRYQVSISLASEAYEDPSIMMAPISEKKTYDAADARVIVGEMVDEAASVLGVMGLLTGVSPNDMKSLISGSFLESRTDWDDISVDPADGTMRLVWETEVMRYTRRRDQEANEYPFAVRRKDQIRDIATAMVERSAGMDVPLMTPRMVEVIAEPDLGTADELRDAAAWLETLYPENTPITDTPLYTLLGQSLATGEGPRLLQGDINTYLQGKAVEDITSGQTLVQPIGGTAQEQQAAAYQRSVYDAFRVVGGKEPNIKEKITALAPQGLITSTDPDVNKAANNVLNRIVAATNDTRNAIVGNEPWKAGSLQLGAELAEAVIPLLSADVFGAEVEQERLTLKAKKETDRVSSASIARDVLDANGLQESDLTSSDLRTVIAWVQAYGGKFAQGEETASELVGQNRDAFLANKQAEEAAKKLPTTFAEAEAEVKEAMLWRGLSDEAYTSERITELARRVLTEGMGVLDEIKYPAGTSIAAQKASQYYLDEAEEQRYIKGSDDVKIDILRRVGMSIPVGEFETDFRKFALPGITEGIKARIRSGAPVRPFGQTVDEVLGFPTPQPVLDVPPQRPYEDREEYEMRLRREYPAVAEQIRTQQETAAARKQQLATETPRGRLLRRLGEYAEGVGLKSIAGESVANQFTYPVTQAVQTSLFPPALPPGILGPLHEYGIPAPGELGYNPYFPSSYTKPAHWAKLGQVLPEGEALKTIGQMAYQDEPFMEYLQGIDPQLEQEYGALRPTGGTVQTYEPAESAGILEAARILSDPTAPGHEEALRQFRGWTQEEQVAFQRKVKEYKEGLKPIGTPPKPVGTFAEYLGSQEERLRNQYYQTPEGFQEYQKQQKAQATAATQTEQTRLQGIETAEYERRQKLRKPRTIYQPLGVR